MIPINVRYCVCSIPRSGSTLLCSALEETKAAGRPAEHFLDSLFTKFVRPVREIGWLNRLRFESLTFRKKNYKFFRKHPEVLPRYTHGLQRRESAGGVYGVKLHHHQYLQHIHPISLDELFGAMRYLAITRRDRVRQAVSWARAEQTRQWYYTAPQFAEPTYDFARIVHAHALIINEEQQWNAYFREHQIDPLRLVYEDLVLDYRAAMREVLSYLGLPTHAAATAQPPGIPRQSDELNSAWTERYTRELDAFAKQASAGAAMPDVRYLLADAA